jgi:hypothetical protein
MRKLSVILLLVGITSSFVVSTYLDRLYAQTRPTAADVASGHVYEHSVRGGEPVYLTLGESWMWASSFYGGVFLAIIGGILFEREMRKGVTDAA